MAWDSVELEVKILVVTRMYDFRGQAIVADDNPKYVVTALIVDSEHERGVEGEGVAFTVFDVAFFAIHSLQDTFGETDVLGQTFKVRLEMKMIDDQRVFLLFPSDS